MSPETPSEPRLRSARPLRPLDRDIHRGLREGLHGDLATGRFAEGEGEVERDATPPLSVHNALDANAIQSVEGAESRDAHAGSPDELLEQPSALGDGGTFVFRHGANSDVPERTCQVVRVESEVTNGTVEAFLPEMLDGRKKERPRGRDAVTSQDREERAALVRAVRERLEVPTQEAMADRCGIVRPRYNRLETGKDAAGGIDSIQALARGWGTSVDAVVLYLEGGLTLDELIASTKDELHALRAALARQVGRVAIRAEEFAPKVPPATTQRPIVRVMPKTVRKRT